MRLPLSCTLLALSLATLVARAPLAAAQTRAAGWVSVYGASDGLVVVSPQVTAKADVHEQVEVQGGYEVDVISAASVDVLTAASPRGYTEVRQALSAAAAWKPERGVRVGALYTPSWEPDFVSHSVTASGSREWLDARLTTEASVRAAFEEVGRTGAARDTWLPVHTGGLALGVGWVFGPRTLGQLAYEAQATGGFQSSPYRFVRMYAPGSATPFGASEAAPDERVRHAVGASLRHALTPHWFVTASLRLYRDTWQVTSHTEELELQRTALGDRLVAGLSARVYGQSAASFYEGRYVSNGDLPRYRTADKMLARSWTGLAGLRLSYAVRGVWGLGELRLTSKVELYNQRFFDFAPLTSRQSVIGSFGIAGEL